MPSLQEAKVRRIAQFQCTAITQRTSFTTHSSLTELHSIVESLHSTLKKVQLDAMYRINHLMTESVCAFVCYVHYSATRPSLVPVWAT